MRSPGRLLRLVPCALVLWAGVATAQTGVSDDRVSLPDGPGSLEGIGENVDVDPNMGLMSHRVAIDIPQGYPGLTPEVGLNYSSGGGSTVVGIGWSMPLPAIERLTKRGLPTYGLDDEFAADGSTELVKVSDGASPIYRARFEKAFVRYTWHDAAGSAGQEGYWTAEFPDGRIGYYGADASGTLNAAARVGGEHGTFRYHLTEMTDRNGHVIRYTWSKYGNVTLPLQIGWVYAGAEPTYTVTFDYDARTDKVSDGKPGFEELLEHRLKTIFVRARGTVIRRYDLAYESYDDSGGFSRLVSVTRQGRDGDAYPIVHTFEYTRALGVACPDDGSCAKPYVVSMDGALGVDAKVGDTTLIDINGDTLPDVLDTSETGAHRFWINTLSTDGSHALAGPTASATGTQSGYDLSTAAVQVLDIDGDGFADLLNAQQGKALMNRGAGDWDPVEMTLWSSGNGNLPSDFEPGEGELSTVRFMDYDGDKLIDVVKSQDADTDNVTTIYRNTGAGAFLVDTGVAPIEAGFESDSLELNDMNGDGLLDPVQVLSAVVRYRLNLGWGQWGPWEEITGFDFTDQEAIEAELEDLNGDGLADLVLVAGDTVRYWLNRNGASFDAEKTITHASLADGQQLPSKTSDTLVLFADMNGSGSSDVVWVDNSGQVTYLEIFPVRPNLIAKITNSIGKVTEVSYSTAALQQAADGGPGAWEHPLASPTNVVAAIDEYDTLSNLHQVTTFTYRDGYYDGVERDFRGFASVDQRVEADAGTQEASLARLTYDVGATDAYHNGLMLTQELHSGEAVISVTEDTWTDCPVAGAPASGLLFDVRHICRTARTVEIREGLTDQSQWATSGQSWSYDGYGNVTLTVDHGITSVGGACDPCDGALPGTPCGEGCEGDEQVTAVDFVSPETNADRWLLRLPWRERSYREANPDGSPATSLYAETLTYYDGPAFEGLPQGEATTGSPTRVLARKDTSGAQVAQQRNAYDLHGNLIEQLDPNGSPDDADTHRRRWIYDDEGLNVVATELMTTRPSGEAVVLRRETTWDPDFDKVASSTDWQVFVNGEAQEAPAVTSYAYDQHGRIIATALPGASLSAPSAVYEYALGSPVSQTRVRQRSVAGGDYDLEEIACFDGFGREIQRRTRIDASTWQVTGYTVFNTVGSEVRRYNAYESASADCDTAPPAGEEFVATRYDGLNRPIEKTGQAGDSGERPTETLVYGPFYRIEYDAADNDASHPHADTPTVVRLNGLQQPVAWERYETPGGAPVVHRLGYDDLGNLTEVTDPAGVTRYQTFDMLSRVVEVVDPNRGVTLYTWDDAGNLVREEDGEGVAVVREYDGQNRTLASWVEGDEAATRAELSWDVRPAGCSASKCAWLGGRLAARTFPHVEGGQVEEWHGYDLRGQNAYLGHAVRGTRYETLTEYDHAGREIATTYPTGHTVTRTWDAAGRLTALSGIIDAVTYTPRGHIGAITYANGDVAVEDRNTRHELSGLQATAGDGSLLVHQALTRSLDGRVIEVEDLRNLADAPSTSATYTYDAFKRLTGATLDPGTDWEETLSFAVDAGERLTAKASTLTDSPAQVGTLTYGGGDAGPHAVTQAAGLTMTYNAAGEMITRGDLDLHWTGRGYLSGVTRDGAVVATYGYDPEGQRVYKRDAIGTALYVSDAFELRGGVASTWITALGRRRAEIVDAGFAATALTDLAPATGDDQALTAGPDGAIRAGDAWLSQATSAQALAFAEPTEVSPVKELLDAANALALLGAEPQTTFLHYDFRGNAVATTDADGAVVSRVEYTPYGQIRWSEGQGPTYGFSGRERDDATGLVYYGARYLDSVTGRWISPDPAFDVMTASELARLPEACSTYGFAFNDPINHQDEDGRIVVLAAIGIGVVAVIAILGGTIWKLAKDVKKHDQRIAAGKMENAAPPRRQSVSSIQLNDSNVALPPPPPQPSQQVADQAPNRVSQQDAKPQERRRSSLSVEVNALGANLGGPTPGEGQEGFGGRQRSDSNDLGGVDLQARGSKPNAKRKPSLVRIPSHAFSKTSLGQNHRGSTVVNIKIISSK